MDPQIKEMHIRLIRYFQAEKSESAMFLLIGGAAIVASIFLWRSSGPWRPMIWPLLGIAAIQIVVGGSVYARTDRQIADLTAKLQKSPPAFAAEEIPRMTVVMRNFRVYRTVEIVLIAAGAVLALFFRERAGWPAVGAGLMLQASAMLLLDFYAERRGELYLEAVRRLLV